MSELLLQQVRLIEPVSGTDRVCDVLIEEGYIKAIAPMIADNPSEGNVKNCRGLVMGPGLVDLYSHSGEPGFEQRETLESLMEAATAGGFTRIAILPDTMPPVDNPGALALMKRRYLECAESFRTRAHSRYRRAPHLYCWGALTLGTQGLQMTQLAELAAAGVVGFADGKPVENLALLRRLLEYLQPLGKPVALWPNNGSLAEDGVMREGIFSLRLGLPGTPAIGETTALATLLQLVEYTGTGVHVMRVSTAGAVEMIYDAKSRKLPVTASTTWMHLLLDTPAIASHCYDPNLRLEPPLGNPVDRESLIAGVRDGVIDVIAIDHSPYTYEEKTLAFAEAPPGAIGLELALPLLWHSLVETGQLSAAQLWRSMSTNPALCLQQKPAVISAGEPAELMLFDPQETWNVENRNLTSRAVNTPWLGSKLQGRVVHL
ncbi:MAG: dihydroorotase [Hormoscilla sp. GM102CHS1]|nr:dihydroorotase [Hormoscilla sp. GM102CHS1]